MHTPECSVVLSLPSTIAKDTEVDEEGNVVKEPTSNHILSVSSKEDHENVSNGAFGQGWRQSRCKGIVQVASPYW
ncbi:hypothetical protein RUM44_009464 [Polyplax serrata]|uniref:Uncharacterized protein n=1 Tax=Polyplax serrata TaxID=468196 RepID=A0ABR1AUG5_POLSC